MKKHIKIGVFQGNRILQSVFITLYAISLSDICLAFHPCPEGTSPDKFQTYPASIIIMLFGIIMIYFFEKKIEREILKRIVQIVTGAIFIFASFVVFAVLNATAPCV